ncbi:hypothetical protein SASPL_140030 [Salvia splendens]|uniref:RING-type domain-containing protein n=1 Tax=Salvia splendens TaxID=180675 RepID=A0A8X8ZC37_SALSN|nr:hypothetical protein SASPL_140030 [Salvia splendens]
MEKGEASGSSFSSADVWAKLGYLESCTYASFLAVVLLQCFLAESTYQLIYNFTPFLVKLVVVRSLLMVQLSKKMIRVWQRKDSGSRGRWVLEVCVQSNACKRNLQETAEGRKQLACFLITLDPEHAKCSICLNVWHDVVTAAPCPHNFWLLVFSNGCFSEWLKRSQERRASVICPQCRSVVQFVGRNHFLHGIEEDILQSDSSLRCSDEELVLLDSCSTIKSSLVMWMASPFTRLGCDRAFSGVYWHAMGAAGSDVYPVCNQETLKPIAAHSLTRLPFLAHEKNRHEQDITEKCIMQMGRPLQDVISEWITKMSNREVDRTRLLLNHSETITSQTYVCRDCYDKLVAFLLYWFRITLPKHMCVLVYTGLCWFIAHELGTKAKLCMPACSVYPKKHSNAKTAGMDMHVGHEEHARKRNHVCRPSRGCSYALMYVSLSLLVPIHFFCHDKIAFHILHFEWFMFFLYFKL